MKGFYLGFPTYEKDNDCICDTLEQANDIVEDYKGMDPDVRFMIEPFEINNVSDLKKFIANYN